MPPVAVAAPGSGWSRPPRPDDNGHTSITWFASLDAVRDFAGGDYERAVVEDAARAALSRWDERVSHHEVAVDLS